MARALITIFFMAVLLWWLQKEFHRDVSFKQHWKWLMAAILVQAASSIISLLITERITGNFFYHAVGGGATTTLLYIYLFRTYDVRLNWRVESVLLYCFVSALGVLNELAEYAGEFAVGVGAFSWDSHDTWRDFVANTSGAFLAWAVYRFYCVIITKRLRNPS